MGQTRVRISDTLKGVTDLGIDSSAFIAYAEEQMSLMRVLAQVFDRIFQGRIQGITTSLTLAEVFVHAKATQDAETEAKYRALLFAPTIRRVPVDDIIAERAADLRAQYRLATPDAIQIATALEGGCDAFLTNDAALGRVVEIPVLVVSRLRL